MPNHVCPWYFGYALANPLRKLYQNPGKILNPYLKSGMKILEVGPGMGFFSLPMARRVGESGKIYSVDVQEKMLEGLRKRARKKYVDHIIEPRLCTEQSLGVHDLKDSIDFALAFAVVHEIPDTQNLLGELRTAMKKGGKLLVSEPKGHVDPQAFDHVCLMAAHQGFRVTEKPVIRGSHSAILEAV